MTASWAGFARGVATSMVHESTVRREAGRYSGESTYDLAERAVIGEKDGSQDAAEGFSQAWVLRFTTAALAVATSLAACGTPSQPSASEDTIVISLDAPNSESEGTLPTALLNWKENSFPILATNDGLTWPVPEGFVFHLPLPELPSPVDPGTGIAVEGDSGQTDVYVKPLFSDEEPTKLLAHGGVWVLPESADRYLVTVMGHWPNGSVGFPVGVQVTSDATTSH
jgi:hypothetical protein